jgi:hypothetical protein
MWVHDVGLSYLRASHLIHRSCSGIWATTERTERAAPNVTADGMATRPNSMSAAVNPSAVSRRQLHRPLTSGRSLRLGERGLVEIKTRPTVTGWNPD